MKDQVTSIEQSKRLMELGVPAEKASCHTRFEYIFYKNKYNMPVMYRRKVGAVKWDYGYPYSTDGLVELERGITEEGRKIASLFCSLLKKWKMDKV